MMSLNDMKPYILSLLLLFLCFSPVCRSKKGTKSNVYCKLPHCGVNNLACKVNKNFSSICSPGTKLISMKPHQERILHLLNNYRNRVALGYTRTLFPAARMARMAWSKELENFAIIYIKKCDLDIQACMSSPDFTNIGSVYDSLTFPGVYKPSITPVLIEELMKSWFENTRSVTRSMLLKHTLSLNGRSARQTVLLMTDRNSHVGCSALTFVSASVNQFRFICTFATDNMRDRPIYEVSADPGKHCLRRDRAYKNLCAVGENYNNNHEYRAGDLLQSDYIFSNY